MAATETEIKTALTLDDHAGEVLKKIRADFESVQEAQEKAQSGFKDFASQAAAVAAGVSFMPLVQELQQFGMHALSVAADADEFDLSLAGLMSGVQGIPWDEAIAKGHDFADELDVLTLKTGTMGDALEDAFKSSVVRQGGDANAFAFARQNIEQITKIAGTMRIPLAAVSEELGAMAEGFIRPKSQLMSLLRTTGDYGDKIKGLQEGWAKITDEQRLEILEHSIATVADRLGNVAPTLPELVTSLREAGKLTVEAFGAPAVQALIPELEKLRNTYIQHRAEIEKFADSLGKDLGVKIHEASELFQQGFEYVRTHADEIHDAIVEAFRYAKSVIDIIIAHKEAIAIAVGAKMLAGSDVGKLGIGAAKAVGSVAQYGYAGTAIGGFGATGVAGAAASLGAFTLAMGAAVLAVDQFVRLLNETKGGSGDEQSYNAMSAALEGMMKSPQYEALSREQIDHVEHLREQMLKLADSAGHTASEVGTLFSKFDALRRATRAEAAGPEAQVEQMRNAYLTVQKLQSDIAAGMQVAPEQMVQAQEMLFGAQEMFSTSFSAAMASNNEGMQRFMANLLVKSSDLQLAFLNSSSLTAEGFQALANLVGDQADDFRQKLEAKGQTIRDALGKQPKPFAGNLFTGGQVFKINQDLRGEDPDRIAFVFHRDIVKAAENRTQASTASIFGT